jgi:hypothetical protein
MKVFKLVNLTPHDINVVNENGEVLLTVHPSGTVARCSEQVKKLGDTAIDDGKGSFVTMPLIHKTLGKVTDLPEPQEGTLYITSLAVAKAVPERYDVVVPGEAYRDKSGRIVGTIALAVMQERAKELFSDETMER